VSKISDYISDLEQWYQQTFHEKPPYIKTWEILQAGRQENFNEFSTPEQQCKYSELLSHLHKVTYLGHYDFGHAISVMDMKEGWKDADNVRGIKMLARFLITFSRVAMMSDPGNDKNQHMSPMEERRLIRSNRSARLINHVMWHNTNETTTMEDWIKWGDYVNRNDLLTTKGKDSDQHDF